MEMSATTLTNRSLPLTSLQFHPQLPCLQALPSPSRLSLQFLTSLPTTATTTLNSRFSAPALRPSPLSRTPFPTSFTTACTLHDESASVTKVASADPSLALMKRAVDVGPELKGTSVFLVGVNSTIKTNVGKLLAEVLRYHYFDSDDVVVESAGGESAAKSYKESDEKGFLETETEVLKQLSAMGRLVVCAGDGAVQSSTNLAFLRYGILVWIDVPLDMVAKEMAKDYTSGNNSEVLTQLTARYEEMIGGYATADATVSLQKVASRLGYDDCDAVSTEDLTMEVLNQVEKLVRVKKMIEAAGTPF